MSHVKAPFPFIQKAWIDASRERPTDRGQWLQGSPLQMIILLILLATIIPTHPLGSQRPWELLSLNSPNVAYGCALGPTDDVSAHKVKEARTRPDKDATLIIDEVKFWVGEKHHDVQVCVSRVVTLYVIHFCVRSLAQTCKHWLHCFCHAVQYVGS